MSHNLVSRDIGCSVSISNVLSVDDKDTKHGCLQSYH